MADLRQSREWAEYLTAIGWSCYKLQGVGGKSGQRLYCKRLPVLGLAIAKLQRPAGKINWTAVINVCKQERVAVLYYEPARLIDGQRRQAAADDEETPGLRQTRGMCLPRKTLWLDLTKSQRQLMAEMKAKTRYNIRLAQRKGVRIKVMTGTAILENRLMLAAVEKMLRANCRRLRLVATPGKWLEAKLTAFGKKGFVTLADWRGKLVAANLFLTSQGMCYYMDNGSAKVGRQLRAPTLAVWQGICEAKKRRLKRFDFEGIDDGTYKSWRGFSRFKQSFGGKEIEFASMRVKRFWPWRIG